MSKEGKILWHLSVNNNNNNICVCVCMCVVYGSR